MNQKRKWLWLVFFLFFVGILATLATRFNLNLLHEYRESVLQKENLFEQVLGTIGFIVVLVGLIVFFARLLQEMRLNQLQSEFLAAISHELKTPITTLELSSQLLREENLSAEERERLWSSHSKELNRLKREVESLLEAARWDSKSIEITRVNRSLDEWITSQWEDWQSILTVDGSLIRQGDPLEGSIRMDPKLLSLVFLNLFLNARKFAIGSPRVVFTTRLIDDRHWEISLRDEGYGFDPNDSEKIFRRFFRARSFAPYSISGSGLGLYFVRSACTRMRIRVKAQSDGARKGATFTLRGVFQNERK